MGYRSWQWSGLALAAWLALGSPCRAEGKTEAPAKEKFVLSGPVTATLEEVPAWGKSDTKEASRFRFPRGQFIMCSDRPSREVKAYPKLKSKKPLYGSVIFSPSGPDYRSGTKYCFVLDESGEEQPAAKEKEEKPAADEKISAPGRGRPPRLQHDRLYFDLDGDLDLTNDAPLELATKPPFAGIQLPDARLFADLVVKFDFGSPLGKRGFAMVPRLRSLGPGYAILELVPKTARQGTIRIAGQEYSVLLSQSQVISGRFDHALVSAEFSPRTDAPARLASSLSGPLGAIRVIDDQVVKLSASPLGDRLSIEPYQGECGLLKIGAGGRTITNLGIAGVLRSKSGEVRAGDGRFQDGGLPRQIKLPVGDYLPMNLIIQHGRLRFTCRMHSEPRGDDGRSSPPLPYSIKIRKDEPFVLNFSGKPAVSFSSPRKGQTFKPGQNGMVRAMLTEPTQGIAITGLWDVSTKVADKEGRDLNRLDPSIVIRNAKGEVVVHGKMPFG
jgi:hypothetical protein